MTSRQINSICILDGAARTVYEPVYTKIFEFLSKDLIVIYAAENDTSNVAKKLNHLNPGFTDYLTKGTLVLVDRDQVSQSRKLGVHSWLKFTSKNHSTENNSLASPRMVLFSHSAELINKDKAQDRTLFYGDASVIEMPPSRPTEVICFYDLDSIMAFRLSELITILSKYEFYIDKSFSHQELNNYRINEYVKQGFSKVLGQETSSIVFKTLQLYYKLDTAEILSNPDIFEQTLHKILGKCGASLTLSTVTREIAKFVMSYLPSQSKSQSI